jgi:glycerol uptake facilitator-like aquaporin
MKKYIPVFMGESIGTFILVLFGCGTVANSLLDGALKWYKVMTMKEKVVLL